MVNYTHNVNAFFVQVEDDVAECRTEIEQKCNEVVNGYTTSQVA